MLPPLLLLLWEVHDPSGLQRVALAGATYASTEAYPLVPVCYDRSSLAGHSRHPSFQPGCCAACLLVVTSVTRPGSLTAVPPSPPERQRQVINPALCPLPS